MRPRRWQGKYGMYIIIISYIFLGAVHTIGYLRSIDEKVHTSLDRSQTDLRSHSSVRIRAFAFERSHSRSRSDRF